MSDAPRHALGDLADPDGFDRLTARMHELVGWYDQIDRTMTAEAVSAPGDAGLDAGDLVAFGSGWRPESIGFDAPADVPTADELAETISEEIVDGFTPKVGQDDLPRDDLGSDTVGTEEFRPADQPIDEPDEHDRDLAAAFDRTFGDGDGELGDGIDVDDIDDPGDLGDI